MLFFKKKPECAVQFFNTAGKMKEHFAPLKPGHVRMYSCGPTVYDYIHIGNLRAVLLSDLVRRTLEYCGFSVYQVMNITDFGHLQSDGDEGDDKMTIALRREGKALTMENMFELATRYSDAFKSDLDSFNAKIPQVLPRASEHVRGMEAYVETLIHKGFAYTTKDGVYFDTAQFPQYGALGGSVSEEHSRVGVHGEKRNPRDFALWKFNTDLGWDAPWGKGFPGWHIECTAMATRYLGKTFDIHTGGIEHIPIHHNNEIAQAEAANGKPYARYWLHHEHILIEGKKISKSLGNTVTLAQLSDRGIHPLAYRYWLLTGHYRQSMNFTWDAVQAAHTTLTRAWRLFTELSNYGKAHEGYREQWERALYDDMNTPEVIGVLWKLLKDDTVDPAQKKATILGMDRVLGVGFSEAYSKKNMVPLSVVSKEDIPDDIERLVEERERARKEKNYTRADEIRASLTEAGYSVEDSPKGPVVKRL